MSTKDPRFEAYMKQMFSKYDSDYDSVNRKLQIVHKENPTKRDELAVFGHFYYYICSPHEDEAREELKIVGMTSLIEAMMTDVDYKDPFQYFESKRVNKNSIDDFAKFKKEYLEKYGSTKKVKEYFKKYMDDEDATVVLKNISRVDIESGKEKELENLNELAKFLYQMRSDFVHKADMQSFCPDYAFAALINVGGRTYVSRVGVTKVLAVFEKSFVSFWKEKSNSIVI